jgi:DNA processing protein
MSASLSPNTQAILLLTAPLIAGRGEPTRELLALDEYNRLARLLRDHRRQPADLMGPAAGEVIAECRGAVDGARLESLLARGFLLSQAVERWYARAIWVISRADATYPKRLKRRLREHTPPLLYGCGDSTIADSSGLAIVGSLQLRETLTDYAARVGALAAKARWIVISDRTRGVDQAAIDGALDAGGRAAAILPDSLERAALNREHRQVLLEHRLLLLSPYDPAAAFDVGQTLERNKLIYALADAALIVSSDWQKGDTWAGAVEQLERLHLVPIFVRSKGAASRGLDALREKGALVWPEPETAEALIEALAAQEPPREA